MSYMEKLINYLNNKIDLDMLFYYDYLHNIMHKDISKLHFLYQKILGHEILHDDFLNIQNVIGKELNNYVHNK
jgi:hypothetical protein